MKHAIWILVLAIMAMAQGVECQEVDFNSVSQDSDDLICTVVDHKPRFPGCEEYGTKALKEKCAQENLLEYLYINLKYPAAAREKKIEGQVVIQFVIEKDGSITNAKIVKNLDEGCDEEALRVVNQMNTMMEKWTPAMHQGAIVRVQYTLPVLFRLR